MIGSAVDRREDWPVARVAERAGLAQNLRAPRCPACRMLANAFQCVERNHQRGHAACRRGPVSEPRVVVDEPVECSLYDGENRAACITSPNIIVPARNLGAQRMMGSTGAMYLLVCETTVVCMDWKQISRQRRSTTLSASPTAARSCSSPENRDAFAVLAYTTRRNWRNRGTQRFSGL
jgi:hypothetical protein